MAQVARGEREREEKIYEILFGYIPHATIFSPKINPDKIH